jgi:hypothetical protein
VSDDYVHQTMDEPTYATFPDSRSSSRHTLPMVLAQKTLKRSSKMRTLLSVKTQLSSHQKKQKTGRQKVLSIRSSDSHTSSGKLQSRSKSKRLRRVGMLWQTMVMTMTSRWLRFIGPEKAHLSYAYAFMITVNRIGPLSFETVPRRFSGILKSNERGKCAS